ncbi:XylR N-terminal domain-containing protein [Marinibacterium sp. SX1]|uniref:XylR N-terminal domain-containing protein n=1 Tax=Marinibacterium sp. SX1 TaxID=3388424 RepID=UPI003D16C98B
MKTPASRIRGSIESAALMDRGGRPTLRELLSDLEFDASSGTLRLNGDRVVLYHSEADRILRRELIQRLGEAEARIFLLRRGFLMGRSDAGFVAASWPTLDRGDAFTAGTRLHMLSGIVRVETVFNDFDFARGRFSADFLWHNSVEAEQGRDRTRLSQAPVCWQQLGYASGYASHFFGSLVVYKETQCAAQGHECCRVVGRLAEGWGEDDPEVILFRSRIEPARAPAEPGGEGPAVVAVPPSEPEAELLRPVLPALERAARLPLPCLIAGAGSSGQALAARHLLAMLGVRPDDATRVTVFSGHRPETAALLTALAPARRGKRRDVLPVVRLEAVDALPAGDQAELARLLAEPAPHGRARLVATATRPLSALASGGLDPALWLRLAPLSVDMPALRGRGAELPALAADRLPDLAGQLGLDLPALEDGALSGLAGDPPGGGLDGLDAVLTALLIETAGGGVITADLVTREARRLAPRGGELDDFGVWIEAQLASGGFSLDAHEARIRAAALARCGGNMAAAARMLGLSRAQLAYREKARGQVQDEGE